MVDAYWASSFFTDAQRLFSADWAEYLRSHGIDVFLPQELVLNNPGSSPDDVAVFRVDTEALLGSRMLIAVLDDETIDSGVAAEAGVAWASGLPVVGVYTDIRRNRSAGAMYKNLYVTGLINSSLGIVHSKEHLLAKVRKLLSQGS